MSTERSVTVKICYEDRLKMPKQMMLELVIVDAMQFGFSGLENDRHTICRKRKARRILKESYTCVLWTLKRHFIGF